MQTDMRWMRPGAKNPDRTVVQIVKWLESRQAARCNAARRHFAIYEGAKDVKSLYGGEYPIIKGPVDKGAGTEELPVSLNVAESVVDTAQAMVSKNQPRPKVSTRRGNFAQQKRAGEMDRAIEGQFHIEALDELGDEATRDAAVCGAGIIKVIPSILEGKVLYERRMPWEIFCDEQDAKRGKPRCMYELSSASKYLLSEQYGKSEEIKARILGAKTVRLDGDSATETSDHVQVYEAWSLPLGGTKGAHVLCVDGALLLREPWEWPIPPFAWTYWRKRTQGIWGKGIIEMNEPLQREIDRMLIAIQEGHKQFGKVLVGIPEGINAEEIDDEIGTHFRFSKDDGQPVFFTPQIFQSEIYNQLWMYVSKMYEMPGVSESRATSSDEYAGESGRAKVIRHNVEAGRLLKPARHRQDMTCQLADLTIQAWRQLDKAKVPVSVRTGVNGGHFSEVDFKDFALDRADYVVRIQPVSKMESDVSGQITSIENLKKAGYNVPERTFRRAMKHLDFDSEMNAAEQSAEFVRRQIDSIIVDLTLEGLADGSWEAPEPDPMCMLKDAFEDVQAAYLSLANDIENDDEEGQRKLQQLRDFSVKIQMEEKKQMLENAPPAPVQDPALMPPAGPAAGGM